MVHIEEPIFKYIFFIFFQEPVLLLIMCCLVSVSLCTQYCMFIHEHEMLVTVFFHIVIVYSFTIHSPHKTHLASICHMERITVVIEDSAVNKQDTGLPQEAHIAVKGIAE